MDQFLKDLPAILVMGLGFILVFVASKLVFKKLPGNQEISRKIAHLGCGVVALGFPFYIHQVWEVGAMCGLFFIFLIVTGKLGKLREIHGTDRKSLGAYIYPAAVFIVFVLSSGKPFLFVSAILVLAVSDTAAALIGRKFGRIPLRITGGKKTLEGSAAFLVTAFISILIPMEIWSGLPSGDIAVTALLAAGIAAVVELFAFSGLDNILIPLAVLAVTGKLSSGAQLGGIGWTEIQPVLRWFAAYMSLNCALIQFMLDLHTTEHGYTEVLPPFLVNSASLYATPTPGSPESA